MAIKSKPRTGKKPPAKSSTEMIFGPEVYGHGYTGVPNIMVRAQARLGLAPVQFNILVQLLSYYYDPAKPPFPTKRELRNRMKIADSTLKKHLKELETAGLIDRVQRVTAEGDYGSNMYRLDGLIRKLRQLAPEFDQEREDRVERKRIVETPKGRRSVR